MTTHLPKPRQAIRGSAAYRRICLAFFLVGFATFSLMYCVQPLLPVFALSFRVAPAEASLALSLTTGLLALAIVAAAPLSERVGRRGLMFGSMATAAALNLAAAPRSAGWPAGWASVSSPNSCRGGPRSR